ncbi:MAG: glucose transporter [Claussenomyces sp. TS43310]|nr:MAG: glucose transporter [Claussenomyces sp. TS43310]
MGWIKPDNVAGSAAPAIMIGLFVSFGGLLFGYDTGTISGIIAMPWWRQQFSTGYINPVDQRLGISTAQTSEIVSILSAGTFFGSLSAAPFGDRMGRRLSLMLAVGVFCFGVILQTISMKISLFVAGRFFAGLGVGMISVLVPLYQSEMAPRWIRGTLVCAYQLAITGGLFIAAIVTYFTSEIDGPQSFRIPIALQFVWAAILLVGLVILPETPRYLIKRGLHGTAAASLSRIRRLDITHPALIEELAEIEANHAYELSLGPSTYRDVFLGSPHLGRRLLTGCGVQMLQQLSGCNYIFYFGTTFFSGRNIGSPFLFQLISDGVNTLSTLPGMVLVESWGRRRLLMVGALCMGLCQLIIASVASSETIDTAAANRVIVIFICLSVFFFAASWGPVGWVITSEIYPLKVRAKSMSISTASNWLLNWALGYSTPFLTDSGSANLGPKIFFVWGVCCLVAVLFVYFMVYETARISLEQIDELYERVDHAWNSTSFQPSWSFQDIRIEAEGVATGVSLADRDETRRRANTTTSASEGDDTISPSLNVTTSSTSNEGSTSEDKIIASLGHVNFDL